MKPNTSLIAATAAAALCGLSMAADDSTTTISIIMIGGGNVPGIDYQGSIIGVSPDETTIAIRCESQKTVSRAVDHCEIMRTATVISGPSTYSVEAQIEDLYTQHIDCAIHGTTQAVCVATEEFLATSSSISAMEARTMTMPEDEVDMVPVTITAGVEKLDATATATTTNAPSATGTESESESASESASESGSTGAAPRITAAAQWAVGGMAAVALAAAA